MEFQEFKVWTTKGDTVFVDSICKNQKSISILDNDNIIEGIRLYLIVLV